MEYEFKNRVAVVSGAGKNLGKQHAKYLASMGAKVLINSISKSCLNVADEIRENGGGS